MQGMNEARHKKPRALARTSRTKNASTFPAWKKKSFFAQQKTRLLGTGNSRPRTVHPAPPQVRTYYVSKPPEGEHHHHTTGICCDDKGVTAVFKRRDFQTVVFNFFNCNLSECLVGWWTASLVSFLDFLSPSNLSLYSGHKSRNNILSFDEAAGCGSIAYHPIVGNQPSDRACLLARAPKNETPGHWHQCY